MADSSILDSIKALLGLDQSETHFDPEIIVHINSAFATLHQLAVGPQVAFIIEDASSNWSDFIQDVDNISSVKTYTYYSVKLAFDPPPTSYSITAMTDQMRELGWRLNTEMEEVRHPSV